MLEFLKNWMSKVWTEIKQGNFLQALKAFFGFSTKTSHVQAKPEEPKLPRVTTPALKEDTIIEVQAGIAASKELAAALAPTIPKTREEQSKEDKAKAAARKKELQERSRAAVEAKKQREEEPTTGRKPQLTQGEAQNMAKMLPFLAMMSLATTGDQVEPEKKASKGVKKPKIVKPKREGHVKKEMQRRTRRAGAGRNHHR